MHQETPLNIDLGITNEIQDCKIHGRMNQEDEGEGIWLMDFIYQYETSKKDLNYLKQ
jgi:hypothetical protein